MPATTVFRIGEEVEVSSTDEGFQGSWYEATVTRSHLKRRFYDVQYATLLSDDDSSRPLVESVRASHLRPCAPRLAPVAGYAVEDLVEGFHNDGWWPGIVSATDGSAPPGRYTVCFPSSREVIDFAPSEIRPRLHWRHGRWDPHDNMHSGRPSLAGEEPDEPLSVSSPRKTKRKIRQRPTSEAKDKALLSNKKLKNGDPSDLRTGINPGTPTVDKESLAALQEFESPPSGLVTLVSSLHVDEGLHKSLLDNHLCVEQRWPKLNKTTESEVLGETPSHCTGNLPASQNINHSSSREIGNFILPEEHGNSKDVCGNSVSVMKRVKKLSCRELICQEVTDITDVKRRSKAETKKKRSRPRKRSTESIISMNAESIISMNAARTELEQPKRIGNGDADSKDTNKGVTLSNRDLLHNDASNTKANTQVGQQVAWDFIQDGTSPSFFTEKVQEISSFANGLNDTAIEVETRDLPPTLKEDCALAPNLTPQVAGNLQNVANFTNGLNDTANDVENRSLSPSPEENCTVARSNSYDLGVCGTSRFGSMHDIEGVEAEIISHQPESADVTDKNQTPSMPPSRSVHVVEMGSTDPSPVVSTIARTLAFVKHSSLWKEIESMEIFRIMPQKPHFHALEQQYSGDFLEGMAMGLMVTFANLEAGMRKLDVLDSQASFEEKLKSLKQLEDNGFNIQSLQSRIQKLLDTRNIIHEVRNKENRMKELMSKKIRIESEKNEVDKKFMEAEKLLASLSERNESLLAQQLELQKTLQATQEAYLCAKLQFHTIVASLS